MNKIALVIMAAGIGSRFGKGIKQLEPVGPGGEIIMDYSIHDALESGFNKVVFIIRKDLEEDFKEIIGKRIEQLTEVEYVFQEISDIPEGNKVPKDRKKPWGTGQAILCCKEKVKEPFVVINADDYYGKEAFKKMYDYLSRSKNMEGDVLPLCMAGFVLGNTLSENGGVTRGVCKVNDKGLLCEIKETHNIIRNNKGVITYDGEDECCNLSNNTKVSMNMWGLQPKVMEYLEEEFESFLANLPEGDTTSEFLLPTAIDKLISTKKAIVTVLDTQDTWFGVTYQEDKQFVVKSFMRLIKTGVYRKKLFD